MIGLDGGRMVSHGISNSTRPKCGSTNQVYTHTSIPRPYIHTMAIQSPSSPPPHQQQRRKRLSLHHTLSAQETNPESPSSQASPLQPSRLQNIMNDDAAEKSSRRKSAHFGDLGVSRREAEADKGKRVTSGAMSVQNTNSRDKVRKRLSAVGVASGLPAPVALEVNSTKFEEWMKLATDNVCF